MNKLELEMSKSRLEFHREIQNEVVKLDKNSLWLNGIIMVVCTPIAVLMVVVGIGYMKDRDWIQAAIEFLLALLQGGLGITAIGRFKISVQSFKRAKAELEQIDSQIEMLERMGSEC